MRHALLALAFVLLASTVRAEAAYTLALPQILNDRPVRTLTLGPCPADLDCIQGYP